MGLLRFISDSISLNEANALAKIVRDEYWNGVRYAHNSKEVELLFEKGWKLINKAIAKNSSCGLAYLLRANYYQVDGKYKEALSDLNKAEKFGVSDTLDGLTMYSNRAEVKEKLGLYKEAIADLDQVLMMQRAISSLIIKPKNMYYIRRGLLKHLANDPDGSIEDLTEAINYADNSEERSTALCYSAMIKKDMGLIEESLGNANTAVRENIENALAYYIRASIKDEKKNDRKGAMEDYDRALELDPKMVEAYKKRAKLRYKLGDFQGVLQDYEKANQLNH